MRINKFGQITNKSSDLLLTPEQEKFMKSLLDDGKATSLSLRYGKAVANRVVVPSTIYDMKYYAFMPFWHWSEVMDERPKDSDFVLGNIIRTTDSLVALSLYSETRCPASQLVEANSEEELEAKIEEMKQNFKNNDWLETNLYPCL